MNIKNALAQNKNTIIKKFEDSLDGAINKGHIYKTYSTVKNYLNLDEPAIVACIFNWGLTELQNTLNEELNKHNIVANINGRFCHKSPLVTWNGAIKDPELGDIFIVHTHIEDNNISRMNALLLQAKMTGAKKNVVSVRSSDQHQLDLYTTWPKFSYVYNKELGQRDITPKQPFKGAQYLLLHNQLTKKLFNTNKFINSTSFNIASACKKLTINRPFSEALFDFVCGDDGQEFFSRDNSLYDEWSKVCHDLLFMNNTFTISKLNFIDKNRWLYAFFANSSFLNLSSPMISTIHLTTSSLVQKD